MPSPLEKNLNPPWLREGSPPPAFLLNPEAWARRAGVRRIAGVDEAGRGPWAGPVVAAAVILREAPLPTRIDDSKRLTTLQRERAFRVILDDADVGVGIVSADQIDRQNILRATLLAMRQAVHDLPRLAQLILVDGPVSPPVGIPCWPIPHGDRRSYVIGCASIVAKVIRDRLMEFYHTLHPQYGFNRHKGYGTALHAARLEQFGPSVFHRRSFRPVAAVAAESGGVSPEERHVAEALTTVDA